MDKYNTTSIIPCSDQNAVVKPSAGAQAAAASNMTPSCLSDDLACLNKGSSVSNNATAATATNDALVSKNPYQMPYQTLAIKDPSSPGGFRCPPGQVHNDTYIILCQYHNNYAPQNTGNMTSSNNNSVTSTFAECQNSYNHNPAETSIICLDDLGENIRGAMAAGETNITPGANGTAERCLERYGQNVENQHGQAVTICSKEAYPHGLPGEVGFTPTASKASTSSSNPSVSVCPPGQSPIPMTSPNITQSCTAFPSTSSPGSSASPTTNNPDELNQVRNATLSKCQETNSLKYCLQQNFNFKVIL